MTWNLNWDSFSHRLPNVSLCTYSKKVTDHFRLKRGHICRHVRHKETKFPVNNISILTQQSHWQTSCMVTPSASHASARHLFMSLSFCLGGMMLRSFSMASPLLIKRDRWTKLTHGELLLYMNLVIFNEKCVLNTSFPATWFFQQITGALFLCGIILASPTLTWVILQQWHIYDQ